MKDITLGQILNLLDINRESEEMVEIMDHNLQPKTDTLDKIRAEIENVLSDGMIHKQTVLGIIDKYKAESEVKDADSD